MLSFGIWGVVFASNRSETRPYKKIVLALNVIFTRLISHAFSHLSGFKSPRTRLSEAKLVENSSTVIFFLIFYLSLSRSFVSQILTVTKTRMVDKPVSFYLPGISSPKNLHFSSPTIGKAKLFALLNLLRRLLPPIQQATTDGTMVQAFVPLVFRCAVI